MTATPDFDPLDADIEANLNNPPVPGKATQAVCSAMSQLIRTLRQAGFNVRGVRSGQVAMVTIPAAQLFAPNSATLKESASSILRQLMPYIKRNDNYKVVIAVHSDDTGDETYNTQLTTDRANAIDEYFYHLNSNVDTGIIPYGLGYDEPCAANNSIADRARNRRVEVYFVPTSEYIEKIRHQK